MKYANEYALKIFKFANSFIFEYFPSLATKLTQKNVKTQTLYKTKQVKINLKSIKNE